MPAAVLDASVLVVEADASPREETEAVSVALAAVVAAPETLAVLKALSAERVAVLATPEETNVKPAVPDAVAVALGVEVMLAIVPEDTIEAPTPAVLSVAEAVADSVPSVDTSVAVEDESVEVVDESVEAVDESAEAVDESDVLVDESSDVVVLPSELLEEVELLPIFPLLEPEVPLLEPPSLDLNVIIQVRSSCTISVPSSALKGVNLMSQTSVTGPCAV